GSDPSLGLGRQVGVSPRSADPHKLPRLERLRDDHVALLVGQRETHRYCRRIERAAGDDAPEHVEEVERRRGGEVDLGRIPTDRERAIVAAVVDRAGARPIDGVAVVTALTKGRLHDSVAAVGAVVTADPWRRARVADRLDQRARWKAGLLGGPAEL